MGQGRLPHVTRSFKNEGTCVVVSFGHLSCVIRRKPDEIGFQRHCKEAITDPVCGKIWFTG